MLLCFQIVLLNYITTLNLIRLCLKHKSKYIHIKKNKQTTYMLHALMRIGVVVGLAQTLKKSKYNYIVYCNKSFLKTIHTYLKPSKKLYVKKKFLNGLLSKNFGNSIFLNTSKGILTVADAHQLQVGGVLLFQLI